MSLEMLTFARPWLMVLLILPLLLAIWPCRSNRNFLRLGNPASLTITNQVDTTRWRRWVLMIAGLLVVVALAGPQSGTVETGLAVGRDVVLVLDISRSMWAADVEPSRWQAAVTAAKKFVIDAKQHGGDRLALIAMAARPALLAPLTTDYDHILAKLERLDARHPPVDARPDRENAPSGTRLGAALVEAIAQHDSRFPGAQEIILFTDADDPADDGEWQRGIEAARAAKIPILVIGLGDPKHESPILVNGTPATNNGEAIRTRLHEDIARRIAEQSGGIYLAARRTPPEPETIRNALSQALREFSDDPRRQPKSCAPMFYAMACLLVTLAWCGPIRVK